MSINGTNYYWEYESKIKTILKEYESSYERNNNAFIFKELHVVSQARPRKLTFSVLGHGR